MTQTEPQSQTQTQLQGQPPRKIITVTHDGIFHADEVFAVALISLLGDVDVIRTRDRAGLTLAIASEDIWVVDVGGVYDPDKLCFDHHQDITLASAAGLVWHHIKDIICPNEEEQKILQTFFDGIDMVDTNRGDIHQVWSETMPLGMRHTSHLIAGFNRGTEAPQSDKAFAKAVKFARKILENEIYAAEKWVQAVAIYEQRITLPNGVAVFSEHNTVWRYYALHLIAVMPTKYGWQILSRDTKLFVIPESATQADGCIFRHANGFMAIFEKREQAIEFAQNLQLP